MRSATRAPALLPKETTVLPSTFMVAAGRGQYDIPPHVALMEDVILDAMQRGDQLLTIEAPVRHGKSVYVCKHLPAWFLGSMPHKHVGLASYEHRFAAGWGQGARDLTNEYGASYGVQVHPEVNARAWWEIDRHGGSMRSMGVGGAITGKGFDLMIVDDPIKNAAQANSEVVREAHWDWLQSTVLTRLEPGALCILMMARWHEADLIGRVHEEMPNEWSRLRLPAFAEADDPLGRPEGAALWPTRFPADNLERRKARVGSYWFNALYQQRPSPPQGRIFQRSWWQRYTTPPPRFDFECWSWDMSFKATDDSSFVVGQLWGKLGANYYLRHQVRGRWDYPTTKRVLVAQVTAPEHAGAANNVFIEDKANGPAIIADLRGELSGLIPIQTGQDSKVGRATAISGIVESFNVWLPEGPEWVHDYIEEHAQFPQGAHDDQVDTTSQALREMQKREGGGAVLLTGDLPSRRTSR